MTAIYVGDHAALNEKRRTAEAAVLKEKRVMTPYILLPLTQ